MADQAFDRDVFEPMTVEINNKLLLPSIKTQHDITPLQLLADVVGALVNDHRAVEADFADKAGVMQGWQQSIRSKGRRKSRQARELGKGGIGWLVGAGGGLVGVLMIVMFFEGLGDGWGGRQGGQSEEHTSEFHSLA